MQGCLFDGDGDGASDRGTYAMVISESALSTYPGGGGVTILEMIPSEDFAGSVRLTLQSEKGLNASLNRTTLSPEYSVTEIIIRPDSTLAFGSYPVRVLQTHNGKSDTLTVSVTVSTFIVPKLLPAARLFLREFVEWGRAYHAMLKEMNYDGLLIYAVSNMSIGGSGTWLAIDREWEVHFYWNSGMTSRFIVRRMGERIPDYYFLRDTVGLGFYEPDPAGFTFYTHAWR